MSTLPSTPPSGADRSGADTAAVPPPRFVSRPVDGQTLRKVLLKWLRLPRGVVYPALCGLQVALGPAQYRARRRWAAGDGGPDPGLLREWRRQGYLRLAPEAWPALREAAARCEARFEREQAAEAARGHDAFVRNPRKRFLRSVAEGASLCADPALLRCLVDESLLRAAAAYLGSAPLLAGAALWWSPPEEPGAAPSSSQLFHTDDEDSTQLKLFVHVRDVADDQGPFTLLPADVSARVRSAVGSRRVRVADEELARIAGPDAAVRLTGPAGSAAFVDTSRCFHFGSRGARRERLVLMVQYLRFHAAAASTFAFRVEPGLTGLDWSPLQRLALGLRER